MHRHRLISFAEEICKQNPNLCMDNLDANSLCTNIPLDETIDTCIDSLFEDYENALKIRKVSFQNLLNVTTKDSLFMFNKKFYEKLMMWL